jgi:hypothetical protein
MSAIPALWHCVCVEGVAECGRKLFLKRDLGLTNVGWAINANTYTENTGALGEHGART